MHHQPMTQRRGSLEAAGDGTPLPPPPPSNLTDTRCQIGLPQPPGPRIRHPLDFCTLRRGRTVQFADQQQNVSHIIQGH